MWKRGSICVTGLVFLLIGCAVYKPMQCKRPTEQWIVQIHEGEPIQKGSPSEQLQRSDYKSDYKEIYKPALYPVKTKPQVVLVCKYGTKLGEIMPYEVPEGMDGLPHFGVFGIDTGNFIILTDYANRMQIFNTDGKLIRVIDKFKNSDEYFTIVHRTSILRGPCLLYRFNDVGRKVPPINIVVTANDGTLHINIYKVKRIDKRWKETDELVSTIIFTVDNTLEKYYPQCIGMD